MKSKMTITILGSGTSTGVPLIHCKCSVCRSKDSKNHRLRASAWIQVKKKSFLIDTSTDLRLQALRAKIPSIDAVLYTHPHADHISGIDELRSFNFIQKTTIPVYGNHWTRFELLNRYKYAFDLTTPKEGGGRPGLKFKLIQRPNCPIRVQGIKILPIRLKHGSKECLGYRINSIAYIIDCSSIPPESMKLLKGLSVLVLDCLRLRTHSTHFNLNQALKTVSELNPQKTFLTHMGHDFDYRTWTKRLPRGIKLAYDGLKIGVDHDHWSA